MHETMRAALETPRSETDPHWSSAAAWPAPPPIAPPAAPAAPSPVDEPPLRGQDRPIAGHGPLAIVEALLKSPASIVHELREGRGALTALAALVLATMSITGLVIATFSGGLQVLLVPIKLGLGIFFCALICLPSLHVLACLSGAEQTVRQTWGVLLMGVALMGVLLVGFAPVVWVFSQASTSLAFMGALQLFSFAISCGFGLGLLRRALSALHGGAVRGLGLWAAMFVLVLLQMMTTLRPLVGPFEGTLIGERTFFLTHWVASLG